MSIQIAQKSEATRLTLAEIRPHLRARDSGSLLASSPLLFLDHPRVDLGKLSSQEAVCIRGEANDLLRSLVLRLQQLGVSAHTRQAVNSEVGHLVMLAASLTTAAEVELEIGRVDHFHSPEGHIKEGADRVLLVAQVIQAKAHERPYEAYKWALANPKNPHEDDQRQALVAWGERQEILRAIDRYLAGWDSGCDDALLVLVSARCPAPTPVQPREKKGFPELVTVEDGGPSPVVLVSAPFAPMEYPSLGLSLLRETISGPKPPIVYLTISFADTVGISFYEWISTGNPNFQHLLGEWIFASSVGASRSPRRYLEQVLCRDSLDWLGNEDATDQPYDLVPLAMVMEALDMVEQASSSIEVWARQLLALDPRIIGFTSVFQQNAATLALARRIKEMRPDIVTVFGGANWEGEMGRALYRSHPFVDVAVSGEGEVIFPEIVARLLNGGEVSELPGVHARSANGNGGLPRTGNAPRPEMSRLPIPDYEDYFIQLRQSGFQAAVQSRPLFESSRGCWWGEKSHCTFCGLNGESMVFRNKPADQLLEEIETLARRHPGYELAAVDNIISMEYFSTLLPMLAEHPMQVSLFYEVKANLSRAQVALLRAAGVTEIQPGIESFSDHVLRLMAKGVTGLQNIQLLKWCAEYEISPSWNFLWGFPGETADDYREMLRLIPLLYHLPPPMGAGTIRVDRFSPNHARPEHHGFTNVRPARAYELVYEGLEQDEIERLAFYFDYDYLEERSPELQEAIRLLWIEMDRWRSIHESSRLMHFSTDKGLLVFDSRPCATEQVHLLRGDSRRVFEVCESAQTRAALERRFGDSEARRALDHLTERHLVVESGKRILNPSLNGTSLASEESHH